MKGFVLLVIVLIFPVVFLAEENGIKWIEFPDPVFKIDGLPFWKENAPDLFRLPKSLQEKVRKPVWRLSKSPSGGRIRFRSDCTLLAVRLQYPHKGNMKNMHTFGQCGVDLYVNNAHEFWEPNKATYMRDVIRNEIAKLRHNGDKNILLVEGFELLGPEFADAFVDAVHPNDLGFLAMAEGLQPYIARVLNVSGNNIKLKR
jgi:hypothetical protein